MHRPVLVEESLDFLRIRPGAFYVDCTLGMGGHAERILELSAPDGRVLGLDRDEEAVRFAENRLSSYEDRLTVVHEDYRMLRGILDRTQSPAPNGILVDLGSSMLQFTSAERGFSFQREGPLDMRMDRRQEVTAESILNHASADQLLSILRQYGEEPAARAITRKIVEQRQESSITTTTQLVAIIESVKKRRHTDRIHPATKTFQALRIAVNRELEDLDTFLFDAFDALSLQGRLVIIAFHSLEDRVVKQVFQFLSAACRCSKRFLQCLCGGKPLSKLLIKKPVTPSLKEVTENPASRSAKLRAIEKISGPAPRELWHDWQKERA